MVDSKREILKSVRQRRFLNKDFDALRADLLDYARTHYPDQIQDFSEASLGGVLLDLAAYVGDVTAFYLDHQFGELFVDSAIEDENIERALREAGVDIVGAAPAIVTVQFLIEVPSVKMGTKFVPDIIALPIIAEGTIVTSDAGIPFTLTEDLDFSSTTDTGELKAQQTLGSTNADGSPASFILNLGGICISGTIATETFQIGSVFIAFRTIALANPNVTEIISVNDTEGNSYHEVTGLTQDTVFRRIPNRNPDGELVAEALEILPAPFRYTAQTNPSSRLASLTFGGGNALTLDDDIIPDPSEFALPLFGKKTFARFTLDPNRLLQTRTLGIAQVDTALTIRYRHGGGLSHNVASNTIVNITTLLMTFPQSPDAALAASIRAGTEATNPLQSSGGEEAPSLDELKQRLPSARNSQARIVSKEDLLARVYTMPSNFGRVFRAGIRSNPNNPLASQLFIISRDSDEKLILSPDTLKLNLAEFLNEFRLISDAIDVLDARVINIGIEFEIVIDPSFNKKIVIQDVIRRLASFFEIRNFQIDQPIILSDVTNIVFNNPGVVAVNSIEIVNFVGLFQNRLYSFEPYDVRNNTIKSMVVPPPGGIFELKFPSFDIKGVSV